MNKEVTTQATRRSAPLLYVYGALALSLVLGAVLAWQLVDRAQMKRGFANEKAKMSADHVRSLRAQAEPLLRTIGTLLGLVISTPLAAEDFATIETQIKGLIREKQIVVVAVADSAGVIRIATNHKLEGQPMSKAFSGLPKAGPSVAVAPFEDGLVALIPVTEAGVSVGRAVIFYSQKT